jgi:hypothetical protein
MTTISYAVTVCDEIDELIKLISFLSDNKKETDEIVVQYDSSKVSDEVTELSQYIRPQSYRISTWW